MKKGGKFNQKKNKILALSFQFHLLQFSIQCLFLLELFHSISIEIAPVALVVAIVVFLVVLADLMCFPFR